ncbi:hypothetical protein BS11774_19800 [Bacillus subtilis]|uniref:MFS transporter n=1 Tax=Bacillus subtilis TaxID=1423 RepID=UPI000FF8C72F|nr:MFS transporter [Bacillus subtilis]QAR62546.1 hypothetical protein BS11774_19800 [Bacillus subtilis]
MKIELNIKRKPKTSAFDPSFRRLFTAVTLTSIGDGLTFNALPWVAASLTSNTILASFVSSAIFLPWLLFSLPFGILIDRYPRNLLMAVSGTVRAVMILLLTVLIILGWATVPLLIILTFLFGTAKVMFDCTAQTIVPMVVKSKQLEKANGLFASVQLIASDLLGGALAGILILIGLPAPFVIDVITSVTSIPLLMRMKGNFQAREERKKVTFKADLKEGLLFVWNDPLLRPLALFGSGVTMVFSMITAMQVFFMKEILHLSSFEFGLLISFATVGSVIGGRAVSNLKIKLGARKSLLISILTMGICYGIAGLSSNWYIVGLFYFIASFFIVVWGVLNVTYRQRIVPQELLGRVNTVFRFLSWGVSSIGTIIGGILVSVGEVAFNREWALRLPYLVLLCVYIIFFFIAIRLFSKERLEGV